MKKLCEGQLIVTTTGLGRIHQVGRYCGADGAWIVNRTGDPSSTVAYPTFAPAWCIRLAVIGETVCPKPRGRCFCGLTHVTAEELSWLPRKAEELPCLGVESPVHG